VPSHVSGQSQKEPAKDGQHSEREIKDKKQLKVINDEHHFQ
jgi:hypothetical protein